ncbi:MULTISPECIES: copper homeostasis membrane protein CopD [unclassified Pseudomonas]|uniref:copper homeostasis membrane protein CopD n=1 Tax=unclassified Pseudomonas TaxID=196821 RepID=UPI0025F9FF0A|nr:MULTISPECIES: copper homeostasis membrane protein CopD [unclassified Pseudomonas]
MQEGLILCRFVHFGAVLLLFGTGLFRHVLFSSALQPFDASPAGLRLDRARMWMSVAALLSALGWLMLTAASMAGDWQDAVNPATVMRVLGHTFFGHVWIAHLALNALTLRWALRAAHSAPRVWMCLTTLLLLTLAPVGHGAMFDGLRGDLLIFNQMLHLIGVGTWLGGLLMLGVLLRAANDVDLRSLLQRFSGLGYGLVALIIVTGMINVRALSGAVWPQPALSGFGLVLAVKVALVLCMLLLAGVNRGLARAPILQLRVLCVSLLLEGAFGAAALAAVSLLGTLPPLLG